MVPANPEKWKMAIKMDRENYGHLTAQNLTPSISLQDLGLHEGACVQEARSHMIWFSRSSDWWRSSLTLNRSLLTTAYRAVEEEISGRYQG